MKLKAEKHPSGTYARVLFMAETPEELHELDLIHQGLMTTKPKEARFEGSDKLVMFFETVEDFPTK